MHTRDRLNLQHAVKLARSANYLAIVHAEHGEAKAAAEWHDRSRKHLAEARAIKAAFN